MIKVYKIALCGNPNSGKTSIFNALTGSHQHVGNWPGVTVERKEGDFTISGDQFRVVDLPGTYSLSANSIDEKVARDFIVEGDPDLTIVVIDQTNIERNLYLALEVIEMGKPVLFALNMDDEATKLGIEVNETALSKFLEVSVCKTVATRKRGIEKLKEAIKESVEQHKIPKLLKFSEKAETIIEELSQYFKDEENDLKRWYAIKTMENDDLIAEKLSSSDYERIFKRLGEIETKLGNEADILLAEERYAIIHGLAKEFVKKVITEEGRERLSTRIDAIVTHRIWGIPIFIGVMWLMFQSAFFVGGYLVDFVDVWFSNFAEYIGSVMGSGIFSSFISEAIIGGLGAFCVFLPQLFILFLFIAFLGDIGYMSRAAFVMDRFMHTLGLHGKSFIPMLLGFGCTVPGIMAARTLESRKDRVLTILITPLMSCGARLPVYALLGGIFFPGHEGTVTFILYLLGIVLAIIMARIFKSYFFKGEETIFIMELPPYRLPSTTETFGQAFRNSWSFLKKAGTFIFLAVVIIWLLSVFPAGVDAPKEDNYIGTIGKVMEPVFRPLGFEGWEAGVALTFGVFAKEIVVGTFGTLFTGQELGSLEEFSDAGVKGPLIQGLKNVFPNALAAFSFMIFVLIYTPCVAALATIKQEIGWKWMIFTAFYLFTLAYVSSLLFYNIGMLFF
jgi:ferrous iron transport protein B